MVLQSLMLALPECFLLGMIVVVMLMDLFLPRDRQVVTYTICQLTLIVLMVLSALQLYLPVSIGFHAQYVMDGFASLSKLALYVITFFVLSYGRQYNREHNVLFGEFHILLLISLLGAMVLLSANSMLLVYLGLEMVSLPVYAMVAIRRARLACGAEAAVKYFIMGAIASGLLLYGMSLLYGATGTLSLPLIKAHLMAFEADHLMVVFAMVFILIAICFKLGAVPFHMWVPDVYEGSPTSVTAFLATVPKLAAFGMLIRMMMGAMPALYKDWQNMFLVMAILSIFFGNILALVQDNLKRMLGYSTMSHMGFVLLGVSTGTLESIGSAFFYIIAYILMAAAAFGVILALTRCRYEADMIKDFSGLNTRHPWLAFLMSVIMFSMAGIPPLLGFDAKLFIIKSLVSVEQYHLAIFALIMSVVGAFYYIRVIKVMYFDSPTEQTPLSMTADSHALLSVNSLLLLGLGLFPTWLFNQSVILLGRSVFV